MFEEELAKYDSGLNRKETNTEAKGKELKSVIEDDNTEEALAAGVMGNLNHEVVFILEGDRISATSIKSQEPISFNLPVIRLPIISETNEEIPEVPQEIQQATSQEIPQETRDYTQVAEKINAEQNKPVINEEKSENIANMIEDVTARKPNIGTQESRNDADTNSKSFEKGNPSPLENENDRSQVHGQSEKNYADTINALNNAAEEQQPINNIVLPPLSEGIRPEQFQASQQMTQAALSAPVKTENLFEAMISRVEMMQNDTKSAMTIQLNPEFLGKVALEVAVDAAGLHVKINAEDSGVRSMINSQITALLESLENKGLAVAEVEVIYTGINNGAFKEPGDDGQHQQSRNYKPVNRDTKAIDGVAYYTTLADLQDYYFETGVSSVEFSA